MFHDVLGHGVAGLVTGDYTMSGKSQLIACSVQGESNYEMIYIIRMLAIIFILMLRVR